MTELTPPEAVVEVWKERLRQTEKHGDQAHLPNGTGPWKGWTLGLHPGPRNDRKGVGDVATGLRDGDERGEHLGAPDTFDAAGFLHSLVRQRDSARAWAVHLEQAIAAVTVLHQPCTECVEGTPAHCNECDQIAPCPTWLALHPEGQP